MKLDIRREEVWVVPLKDHSGALAEKLDALAKAGVNLNFLIARRVDRKRAGGVLFVTPIRGARQQAAAKSVGFKRSDSICAMSVGYKDRPGWGAAVTNAIAVAGVNLRGLSGASIGKRAVLNLAFDSVSEVAKARRALNKL